MLGEKLYTLRRKLGLSQEQLAERIGVSRQTISKWEGDQSTPDLEKLMALADCFQVSMDELTGYDRSRPQPEAPTTDQTPVAKTDDGILIRRIAGLALCILGLLSLVIAVLILFLHPQAMESLGNSFAVTIDGSGVVYGMCIMAVVVGVYLIVRKD